LTGAFNASVRGTLPNKVDEALNRRMPESARLMVDMALAMGV